MDNQSLLDAAVAAAILNQQQQNTQQQSELTSLLLAAQRQPPEQQQHQHQQRSGLVRILQGTAVQGCAGGKNLPENDPIMIANLVAAQRQLELAKLREDAIVNEAYRRGREEALLSFVRAGAIESLLTGNTMSALPAGPASLPAATVAGALPAAAAEVPLTEKSLILSLLERKQAPTEVSKLPAKKRPITNEDVLKTLGNTSVERREKNVPYFDASSLSDPDPATLQNRKARGGVTEAFPEKLHRMLVDVENSGETDIVGFFPHGRAFAVHNPTRFVSEIMPKYFRQSRLSSFQRQLNLYGFTRISCGPDTGGYYHELFLRGRPALAVHMRRVGVPQGKPKDEATKLSQGPAHPDFYKMDPVARR